MILVQLCPLNLHAQDYLKENQFDILDRIEGKTYQLYNWNDKKKKWELKKGFGRKYEKVKNKDGTYDIVQIRDGGKKMQYKASSKTNPYGWQYESKSYLPGAQSTFFYMVLYKDFRFSTTATYQGGKGDRFSYNELYCSNPKDLKGKTKQDIIDAVKTYHASLYKIDHPTTEADIAAAERADKLNKERRGAVMPKNASLGKNQLEIAKNYIGKPYTKVYYNQYDDKWQFSYDLTYEIQSIITDKWGVKHLHITGTKNKYNKVVHPVKNSFPIHYKDVDTLNYKPKHGNTFIFYRSFCIVSYGNFTKKLPEKIRTEEIYCANLDEAEAYENTRELLDEVLIYLKSVKEASDQAEEIDTEEPKFTIEDKDIVKIELKCRSSFKNNYTPSGDQLDFEIIASDKNGTTYSTKEYHNFDDYSFDLKGASLVHSGNKLSPDKDFKIYDEPNVNTCQTSYTVSSKYHALTSNTVKHWIYMGHHDQVKRYKRAFDGITDYSVKDRDRGHGLRGSIALLYIQKTGHIHPENGQPIYVLYVTENYDNSITKCRDKIYFQSELILDINCDGKDGQTYYGGGSGGKGGDIKVYYDPEVPWNPKNEKNKLSVIGGQTIILDKYGNEETLDDNNGLGTIKIIEQVSTKPPYSCK